MGENLKESDVEKSSTSDALKDTIANVHRKTRRKVSNSNTNTNTNGTCDTEHDVGENKVFGGEVRLGNMEPKTEGHDSFVQHHCNRNRKKIARRVLQSNSDTL